MRKATYRYRHALAPHATVLSTWGAGAILHATDTPAWQALVGEAAALTIVATVRAFFPHARERMKPRMWWAAAALWLPLAAEFGAIGSVMQSLLFGVGGLLAIPRVFRYRARINQPSSRKQRAIAAAETKAIEMADPVVELWHAKTSRKGRGALPNSELSERQPFEHGGAVGVRYRVVLDGHTTEDAMAARKRICADYGKAINYVHVEEPEDGAQNAAIVTFLSKLAVEDPEMWTEPLFDIEAGIMPVGPFEDGLGDAALQVFEPDSGPLPVGIFGAQRTGKSSLLKIAAAEFAAAGNIVLDYLDPQGGQSCPALLPYVPHALGVDAIRERLYAYREEMRRRNELLSAIEWIDDEGTPQRGVQSYARPGAHGLDMLVIAIDEFHKVARHEDLAEVVYDILAEGSKCGMVCWILDQNVYVGSLGGGDILALVCAGNIVVMRNADARIASATFGQRMNAYPHLIKLTFPGTQKTTKGCGYVLGATDRPVMMRARHIPKIKPVMAGRQPMRLALLGSTEDASALAESVSPARPAAEAVSLDGLAAYSPISAPERKNAETKIKALLYGAVEGLDGGELTLGTEMPFVTVFQVATGLIEKGEVQLKNGRYVLHEEAS
ncbi:hypothetical protein [Nonomuraea endophytica]|uniref:hypothetical protein n=1 Tax=Nonomuraea endophytica TaxID=714136 RepID=UPI0037C52970